MTKRFTFEMKDKDDTILRDGETLTNRMMMRDSISKPIQDALDATEAVKVRDAAAFAAARRPGFFYADSAVDSRETARAAARQLSYDSYDRDISTAWQRKAPVADVDTRQAWHDSRNAELAKRADVSRTEQFDAVKAEAAKQAAYDAVDAELVSAYRKCPSQF